MTTLDLLNFKIEKDFNASKYNLYYFADKNDYALILCNNSGLNYISAYGEWESWVDHPGYNSVANEKYFLENTL